MKLFFNVIERRSFSLSIDNLLIVFLKIVIEEMAFVIPSFLAEIEVNSNLSK